MYDEWDDIESQLNQLSNLVENNENNENIENNYDNYDNDKNFTNEKSDYSKSNLKNEILIPKASNLRISTITALNTLSTSIDLSVVNKYLNINNNIILIDPGGNDPIRGDYKKKSSKVTKKKKNVFQSNNCYSKNR